MAEKATAKQALEKLKNKLECSICLTEYTDPKLLPCFHVFCKQCLEPLVIQDHDDLSLQCPICRHSTKLPPKGVAGLQSDFHVEHLFEIRNAFEKANQTTQKTKCENCEDDNATVFCRDCGEFICDTCTTLHRKWKQFKSHEIASLEEVQTEATNLVQLKKQISYCPRHKENILKIFCETCSELICIDCTIKLHQGHNYDLVADVLPKHKDEMVASLQPVKKQLSTVNKALHAFEERVREIEEQKMTIEAAVHKEINSLQQLLEQRRTQLISKLDHLSQLKLKALASQRDQVELVQVKLSSCVDYVEGGLKTGTEGEVLAMKVPVMKRIEQITAESDFKSATLQPEEEANLELIATNKQDIQQACKEFGDVGIQEVSPENSYARGEGLERAIVGDEVVAMVTAMSVTNRDYTHQINLTAELVHCKSKSIVPTEVQNQQNSRYKITYQPTKRGKHQLSVKINGREIKDSPFTIAVTSSPQSLGRPVRVIGNLKKPFFVTTNSQNQIIVTESSSRCVSVFSPEGKKFHSFGSEGTNDGQFQYPTGVTVDNVGNIYVVDNKNHRIQKFTSDGKFLQSVGTFSSGQLQFQHPMGVSFNPNNQKLYVCDQCIQVLNPDLTFHSTIGREGTGNGEFKNTADIAFNSKGDIYVTDFNNHHVQIFNQDGTFSRTLTKKQQGETLQHPVGIAVDSSDTVYVSERDRGCISVFTAEGEYLASFGSEGKAEGQFDWPFGLHIDKNDSLLVCDNNNGRIQNF